MNANISKPKRKKVMAACPQKQGSRRSKIASGGPDNSGELIKRIWSELEAKGYTWEEEDFSPDEQGARHWYIKAPIKSSQYFPSFCMSEITGNQKQGGGAGLFWFSREYPESNRYVLQRTVDNICDDGYIGASFEDVVYLTMNIDDLTSCSHSLSLWLIKVGEYVPRIEKWTNPPENAKNVPKFFRNSRG